MQVFGSDKSEINASTTVSILTFPEKEYVKYHEQVYMIILANLKINNQVPTINKLLMTSFEQVIDVYLKNPLINLINSASQFPLGALVIYTPVLAPVGLNPYKLRHPLAAGNEPRI